MGLFHRLNKRKSTASTEQVALNQLLDWLGVSELDGGELSNATYFACLKVLSESIGKLPLKLQQATPTSGIRIAREHRYYRMLNERPNRYMTATVFWSTMELCRNHYGNAYALIDTSDPRAPQLWPLPPRSVQVLYDNAKMLKDTPDLYYAYSGNTGTVVFGSEEILHFKSHCTLDGLVGVSVREQLAGTIHGSVKAQKMINKMYESGMTAKAVLQYTGSLKDASKDALTKGIEAYARGEMKSKGIENIIPIPLGMNLTPLNIKLADNQFVELSQFTALQIASAFGIPPMYIGDYTKSSYASAEAQQLSFLTNTLLYVIAGYEQEIAYKLLTDEEAKDGYHVKLNTAVILRSDQKTQVETLSAAVSTFLYTPNEAREKLDLPSLPGGDQLIGNGSTIPITAVGAQWTDAEPEAEEESEPETEPENTAGEEEDKAWIRDTIKETLQQLLG